jgi:plasmid stabilization system protein ParE
MGQQRDGDLAGIYAHIAQDSPRFALRVVDRITQRTKQLAAFPYSGQVVPEYNRDEVREVIEYSYRLIYILENQVVHVVAVIHGARPLPDSPMEIGG